MSQPQRPPLSSVAKAYIAFVVAAGLWIVGYSCQDLLANRPSPDLAWLALLTLLSGFLPLKLPKVAANISVSETFVFCGTLLFGPSAGAILVFLDVALIWARLSRQEVYWHRMLFSLAANPLAIWIAAAVLFQVAGTGPLAPLPVQPPDGRLILGLLAFAIVYFVLNSSLVAFAIALEQNQNAFEIWSKHLSRLWLNYWAGASVAALLVSIFHTVTFLALSLIAPLMLVLYFTYRWSMEKVEKAEAHLADLKRTFLQTIEALALAIDAKDQVTHGHIRRVQRHTMALADSLGVKDDKQLDALRAAALLHDTGKLAVPEYILNKPGALTVSEFERMKVHAAVGADILKNIEFPYPVEPIVRYHHENWDGSGYPEGIKGSDIPLGARILSVVDCYDALTSDRPYRPRMTRQQAEQVLLERRGKHYDPWVVDRFLSILDKLERQEAEEQRQANAAFATVDGARTQYEAISATTAEDREFNELRRDLPRATSIIEAGDLLFRHIRRILPAAGFALYRPRADSTELVVSVAVGIGASALDGLRVPIGERISGWVFAHGQPVLNSDATLEIGPVARTFPIPLRFAAAVPVIDVQPIAVIAVFGSEPFHNDHRRLLENVATLFVSSLGQAGASEAGRAVASSRAPDQDKTRIH
jgi:putative nucleotidyltransferase with HDIG domain